jgi:hypothetical protein
MKLFKTIQLAPTELLSIGCKALTITIINGSINKNIVKKIYGKTIKKAFT